MQFFAFNLENFTPDRTFLHGHLQRGVAVRNAGWKLNSASIYLKPPLHVDEVARKINGLSNLLILALKL